MSVLAHSSCEEKISSSLQGPGSCARIFHPLRMSGQMGSPLALTFFMMFRHARSIGGQEADFNNKLIAALLSTRRSETSFTAQSCRSTLRQILRRGRSNRLFVRRAAFQPPDFAVFRSSSIPRLLAIFAYMDINGVGFPRSDCSPHN